MGQVTVTVAGRAYRVACDDGEEQKLADLGAALESRVANLRATLGEVGDLRLLVMAAITCLDDLNEREAEVKLLRAELAGENEASESAVAQRNAAQQDAAAAIVLVAERLEVLAREIAADPRG
jgi:cell division protein ZapA